MKHCKHPERPAVARCVACGVRLCEKCRRRHESRNYCAECWPGRKVSGLKSPTFAFLLGAVPGLGQLYSGSVLRGILFLSAAIFCVGHGGIPAPLPVFLALFSAWDGRGAVLKRNRRLLEVAGRPVKPGAAGASEADWLLWLGAALIAGLYLWLPAKAGFSFEPWMAWIGFTVAFGVSLLLGRSERREEAPAPVAECGG